MDKEYTKTSEKEGVITRTVSENVTIAELQSRITLQNLIITNAQNVIDEAEEDIVELKKKGVKE